MVVAAPGSEAGSIRGLGYAWSDSPPTPCCCSRPASQGSGVLATAVRTASGCLSLTQKCSLCGR